MTTEQATAEKTCPYCAETIKAAAIRCRFCGSDLDPAPLTEVAPAPPVPAPALGLADEGPRESPRRWPALVLALVVLVLASVLVRMLVVDEPEPPVPSGLTPLSPGVSFTDESAKSAGLSAATRAAERVLSYSAGSLDQDIEQALPLLSPGMQAEYRSTLDAIREETGKNKAVVEAAVVAASAISASEHDVKALLFVNQTTTGKHLERPRADLNRVVVTLHRDAGDWIVTDLDAL